MKNLFVATALLVLVHHDALAGLRQVIVTKPTPTHTSTAYFWDTWIEANDACLKWATPKGLPCGGHGGPGLNTGASSAGWYDLNYQNHYYCSVNHIWDPSFENCRRIREFYDFSGPQSCSASASFGNPIEPLNGRKHEIVDLGIEIGGQRLSISYDSLRPVLAHLKSENLNEIGLMPIFGGAWAASWVPNLYKRGVSQESTGYILQHFDQSGKISAYQGSSASAGAIYRSASNPAAQIKVLNAWDVVLQDPLNSTYSTFTLAIPERFAMKDRWHPAGPKVEVRLSSPTDRLYIGQYMISGMPIDMTDQFGRKISFEYSIIPSTGDPALNTKLKKIISPAGNVTFSYSTDGILDSITWPDGNSRKFLYETTPSGVGPLLVGVEDENHIRLSTFGYDVDGYVASTSRAGNVDHHSTTAGANPRIIKTEEYESVGNYWRHSFKLSPATDTAVQLPNGESLQITSKSVRGLNLPTSFTQPAGSGCAASTRRQDYDANGNLAWKENFNGHRTCLAHDVDRNLETSRVEGLSTDSACEAVLTDGTTLPIGSRRISTRWHPVWNLSTQVAEPRRLTTRIYNGQPDPFNAGAIASCAPSTALLPNGSPIVVLCKMVEQATTDNDGAMGFAAPLVPTADAPIRVQQWTYNQYGQVLTHIDPLNNTTTYTYHSSTTTNYTLGDLATVKNALNQTTSYNKYNRAGQWLEMVDANGTTTVRTFDLRQRLKTSTTATFLTTYDYWPSGLLKSVTLPDTSFVNYDYDDAHRLTSVTDNLGNKITYTLDTSGNRIGEKVEDPTGTLSRTLTRVPDALNRLQQVTGRE